MRQGGTSGFTLLELSMVLAIIGLVVGGILAGKTLIHSAEIRALAAQPAELGSAIHAFQEKYNCLPGDCRNASALGFDSPAMGGSANGNGDGKITYYSLQQAGASLAYEGFNAADQLKKSGLAKASKVSASTNPGAQCTILDLPNDVYNLPISSPQVGQFGWILQYFRSGTVGGLSSGVIHNGHYLWGGAFNPYSQGIFPLLKPEDVFEIDSKIDDGKPRSGKILAQYGIFFGDALITNRVYTFTPYFDATDMTQNNGAPNDCLARASSSFIYNITSTTAKCALTWETDL